MAVCLSSDKSIFSWYLIIGSSFAENLPMSIPTTNVFLQKIKYKNFFEKKKASHYVHSL